MVIGFSVNVKVEVPRSLVLQAINDIVLVFFFCLSIARAIWIDSRKRIGTTFKVTNGHLLIRAIKVS